MRTKYLTILLAALLAGFGCDDGNNVDPDAGPNVNDDAGGGGNDDAGTDPTPDAGPQRDGNDDFASATEITINSQVDGVIDPAGDLDYYKFEGTEGQWVQILVEVPDREDRADTTVTLFDSSMTQIADNDDLLPRFDNLASEIITRLPATGTYYVLVQEWSTWADDEPVGGPNFDYEVTVGELVVAATVPVVNIDAEENDDAENAQALTEATTTGGGVSYVLGSFEDETDVDVYSFTIEGATQSLRVNLMQEGTAGNSGAAARPARLWVTNSEGSEIIARVDPSIFTVDALTNVEMWPSLQPGEYRLFVEASPGADFYVLKIFRGGDNPPETMEGTNGDPTTPEPITLEPREEQPMMRSGFILADIGDGDTDYFSITTMGSEQVNVYCGSRSSGSGVVDLQLTLFDETGATEIVSATETAAEGAFIESAAVPSAGTYLVRMTKASQDPEVTSTFARCGFHVAPPGT